MHPARSRDRAAFVWQIHDGWRLAELASIR